MYGVDYTAAAARQVRKLDRVAQNRVLGTIEILRTEPRPLRAALLVGARDTWRVRTGDYRIIYRIDDGRLCVLVIAVGHRRDIYRSR